MGKHAYNNRGIVEICFLFALCKVLIYESSVDNRQSSSIVLSEQLSRVGLCKGC
jgi:hypothetical protein